MGIFLNPGNEKYKSALRSAIYVDKTGMIAYTNSILNTEQRWLCVSRPRRFGKSIAAAMLAAYYSRGCDSGDLFDNLKIGSAPGYQEHLNCYDVIHVDMNVFRHRRDGASGKEITALGAIRLFQEEVLKELREVYADHISEKDVDLPSALLKIYQSTKAKFIIIIDEWDAVFREDKLNHEAQEAYVELLRGLFKNDTSKEFLALGYLTGILPIKKYGTQSALNNFDEFTMTNPEPLEEYVGFTEAEVQALYRDYDLDFAEAQRWYDGYLMENGLHIYNPKSVVDSLRRKKIANYWTRTETYESLQGYIGMNYDGLKNSVIRMLAGGRCKVNSDKFQNDMVSFKSKDDILTLLIHLGYLAYDSDKREAYIPNEEVRVEFSNAVEDAGWDSVMKAILASDELLQATWRMDEEAVAKGIDEVHMANTSILSYNDENALSCVISLAYYHAANEYILTREMPAGKGYADIIFLPQKHSDKPAMIIELKWGQTVDSALRQVEERQYVKGLGEYQGEILLVGINYDKGKKEHQCKIKKIIL